MKFRDEDIRPNVTRPLALSGAMVAPGRDTRWHGVPKDVTQCISHRKRHEYGI